MGKYMGEKLVTICDEKAKELGSANVGTIAMDGYGNEVCAHLTTEDTTPFWLATARGKILALKENDNDNDKMTMGEGTEMFKLMKGAVSMMTGLSDKMPVRGCQVVHYKDPET